MLLLKYNYTFFMTLLREVGERYVTTVEKNTSSKQHFVH